MYPLKLLPSLALVVGDFEIAPRAVISLGGYTVRRRLHVGAAIFVAIFFALFVAMFLLSIMSGEQWRAVQDRARVRRMAEHKMNARLLRLNI
jgi:hypothetical protein